MQSISGVNAVIPLDAFYDIHGNPSSSSAYHSPLLDIGLSNIPPSRSIFGYSYPWNPSHGRKRGAILLFCPGHHSRH
jgi:hypothetical protein